MSTQHHKPVVAFVLLAVITAAVIGIKTAEARGENLLAAAIDGTARVHDVLTPAVEPHGSARPGDQRPPLGPAIASLDDRRKEVVVASTEPVILISSGGAGRHAPDAWGEPARAVTILEWLVGQAVLNKPVPEGTAAGRTTRSTTGPTSSTASVRQARATVTAAEARRAPATRSAHRSDGVGKAVDRLAQRPAPLARPSSLVARWPDRFVTQRAHARWSSKAEHGRFGTHGRRGQHRRR